MGSRGDAYFWERFQKYKFLLLGALSFAFRSTLLEAMCLRFLAAQGRLFRKGERKRGNGDQPVAPTNWR